MCTAKACVNTYIPGKCNDRIEHLNQIQFNLILSNLVILADDINVLITDSDTCALQSKIDRVIAE
jgi:hypothetical protein